MIEKEWRCSEVKSPEKNGNESGSPVNSADKRPAQGRLKQFRIPSVQFSPNQFRAFLPAASHGHIRNRSLFKFFSENFQHFTPPLSQVPETIGHPWNVNIKQEVHIINHPMLQLSQNARHLMKIQL